MQGVLLRKGDFSIFPSGLLKGRDPYQQVVLSWIWKHTNEEGECFPSLALLVKETGVSRSKMSTVLGELEQARLLVKQSRFRKNGGQQSSLYYVVAYQAMEELGRPPPEPEKPAKDTVDWHGVVLTWNKLAQAHGLKTIHNKVSDSRKQHYRRRLEENPDFWGIVSRELARLSAWGRSTQVSTFGWLIAKDSNFERFAEGKYRDEHKPQEAPKLRVAGE